MNHITPLGALLFGWCQFCKWKNERNRQHTDANLRPMLINNKYCSADKHISLSSAYTLVWATNEDLDDDDDVLQRIYHNVIIKGRSNIFTETHFCSFKSDFIEFFRNAQYILNAYFETADAPENRINTWPISKQSAQFSPKERLPF